MANSGDHNRPSKETVYFCWYSDCSNSDDRCLPLPTAEMTRIFRHTIQQTADLTQQASTSPKPEVLVQCGEKN